jgi:hypothetical protein
MAAPTLGFVLSAGRTGTVFLARLLAEQFPAWQVDHEPFPGRYESLLGNLRNDTGLGTSVTRHLFLHARGKRIRSLGKRRGYIEINPLLCPIIDLLPLLGQPIHVVHMVREPLSWANSIATFRASRRIRPFFPFIPFASPYPTPRPDHWARLSRVERQLWRWRVCNERIVEQRPKFSSYQVVRYEDLFSDQPATRDQALSCILDSLGLPQISLQWQHHLSERVNAAPRGGASQQVSAEQVAAICGDLMKRFGYA